MLLSSHSLTVSSPAIPVFLGVPALEPIRSRELTKDGGNRAPGRSNHVILDDTDQKTQAQLKSDHQSSQSGIGGVNPEHVGRETLYEMNHHTSQPTRQEVSQWELLANRQDGRAAYGRDDENQAQGVTR